MIFGAVVSKKLYLRSVWERQADGQGKTMCLLIKVGGVIITIKVILTETNSYFLHKNLSSTSNHNKTLIKLLILLFRQLIDTFHTFVKPKCFFPDK